MITALPHIETSALQLLNAEQAWHYKVIPYAVEENVLCFLCCEDARGIKDELEFITSRPAQFQLIEERELRDLLLTHYRQSGHSKTEAVSYKDDLLTQILSEAREMNASDIHVEPYEFNSRVRYRIDGKLIERYEIPLPDYATFINRIKIQSSLDIGEKRLPQDGRLLFQNGEQKIDIRVSILPTLFGEKAVLRLLGSDGASIDLKTLGFSRDELKLYTEGIQQPNGIVLISGPTGSGKTTTLYGTMKVLNDTDTNIMTIEDPVEYTLEGINQVQVQSGIGLGFAEALRSFLRQDPDVIMLGEIRDPETANMAIRAALTGHLVLSTIHTNSAWESISRLKDMGVPSYLIASTLRLTVAQRLIRKLCEHCKTEVETQPEMLPSGIPEKDRPKTVFQPVGCEHCFHVGYKGRAALYEVIPIQGALGKYIREERADALEQLEEKYPSLMDNALNLLRSGLTSAEEVYPILLSA